MVGRRGFGLRVDELLIPVNLLDDLVVVILVFQIGDPLLLPELPGVAAGSGRVMRLGVVLVVGVVEEVEEVPGGGSGRGGRRGRGLGDGVALWWGLGLGRSEEGRGRIGIVGVRVGGGVRVRVKGGGGLSDVAGFGTEGSLLVVN